MFELSKAREEEFRAESKAKQASFQQELESITEKMLNTSDPSV